MAARPQNIGIKAIEVYFPTQVSDFAKILIVLVSLLTLATVC
jgi:hypothetical protein